MSVDHPSHRPLLILPIGGCIGSASYRMEVIASIYACQPGTYLPDNFGTRFKMPRSARRSSCGLSAVSLVGRTKTALMTDQSFALSETLLVKLVRMIKQKQTTTNSTHDRTKYIRRTFGCLTNSLSNPAYPPIPTTNSRCLLGV